MSFNPCPTLVIAHASTCCFCVKTVLAIQAKKKRYKNSNKGKGRPREKETREEGSTNNKDKRPSAKPTARWVLDYVKFASLFCFRSCPKATQLTLAGLKFTITRQRLSGVYFEFLSLATKPDLLDLASGLVRLGYLVLIIHVIDTWLISLASPPLELNGVFVYSEPRAAYSCEYVKRARSVGSWESLHLLIEISRMRSKRISENVTQKRQSISQSKAFWAQRWTRMTMCLYWGLLFRLASSDPLPGSFVLTCANLFLCHPTVFLNQQFFPTLFSIIWFCGRLCWKLLTLGLLFFWPTEIDPFLKPNPGFATR